MADRQPYPHPRRNRDHRPDSALTTAAASPAGIEVGMRARNLRAASNLRDHGTRRQALGNNRPFLLGTLATPPFRAGADLNPRHRTVSNTSANTITCTSAYPPDPPPPRKAVLTVRIPVVLRLD
jgi:hypothetical protein